MKYLKRFNESKVLDKTVIDECKDILLELEDIGIKTNMRSYLNSGVGGVNKDVYLYGYINYSWITFYFNRKEEFDYSDIEDVVERLKSYLSEWGLKIEWMNPTERQENKPEIKTKRLMDPATFERYVRTECELYFNSKIE